MATSTILLTIIALILFFYAWKRGDNLQLQGVKLGWRTLRRTIPLLLLAFIIVGFVNVLSPQDLIQQSIGPGSGWQGLLLATGIGMLLPGGPYVVFPLIAVIHHAGAGLGPSVTLITSWATQALLTVTFELPLLGWRFTVIRWGLGVLIPPIAGAIAQLLFQY